MGGALWQALGRALLNRAVDDRRHAKVLVEEAISLFGKIGYRGSMLAMGLANSGNLTRAEGDTERAAVLFGESLELC